MKNELSASYSKALELHNKILVSAQLAQNNLWEMCAGLKEMRDGKLYKELGYQNFEEYCGAEFNMSRRNAYYYISIIENMNEKNVKTFSQMGKSKLFLLSTLTESEQEKLTAENDVESMTVRQLEAEVKALKADKAKLEKDRDDTAFQLELTQQEMKHLKTENKARQTTIDEQAEYIREMESRPVEVAVAEPSEDVRQLKLTIKNLERTTDEQLAAVQEEHLAAERRLRQDHAKELESKLTEQAQAYEQKLAEVAQAAGDDKQVFKAYFTAAYDAFNRMLAFAEKSSDKLFFQLKITNLLNTLTTANKNM